MLIKQEHLEGIKAGNVKLLFRKWTKPRVNTGSLILTSIGQLKILDIKEIVRSQILNSDGQLAGYSDLTDLFKQLDARSEGTIFRIEVKLHSADPRIALSNQMKITETELCRIIAKFEIFDKLSNHGPWVRDTMTAIQNHPKLRAIELAQKLGKPKDWLKINIRKLKNMGLTLSHKTGYSLSTRGVVVYNRLFSGNSS